MSALIGCKDMTKLFIKHNRKIIIFLKFFQQMFSEALYFKILPHALGFGLSSHSGTNGKL